MDDIQPAGPRPPDAEADGATSDAAANSADATADARFISLAEDWAASIAANDAARVEWTTDVFVRRDDRWLCVLSHITPAAPDQP